MMITKETELAPAVMTLLRTGGAPAYLVVLAGASHDDFTDGGALTPFHSKGADVLKLASAYTCALFQQTLRGHTTDLLNASGVDAKVRLDVFPGS